MSLCLPSPIPDTGTTLASCLELVHSPVASPSAPRPKGERGRYLLSITGSAAGSNILLQLILSPASPIFFTSNQDQEWQERFHTGGITGGAGRTSQSPRMRS